MKHVLCALQEPNEVLLNHIYEFGRQHGWSVECCGEKIPRHWFGDGVFSDYLTQKELSVIDRFEQTPVVSRILLPRRNIRTVRPDTERIASMIADYFIDKGFTRFVTTPPNVPASMLDGKPRHIQTALKLALAERNFALIQPKFSFDVELQKDYRRGSEKLRGFFERPFALILPSPRRLALVYRILDDLGVRVPEEVAVMVNTDNPMITENAAVPTSCISGEFGELASKMVELLERMMAGEAAGTGEPGTGKGETAVPVEKAQEGKAADTRRRKGRQADYETTFLKGMDIPARYGKPVYVRREYHERIAKISVMLTGGKVSLSAYIDNVLAQHFEQYREEIEAAYAGELENLF